MSDVEPISQHGNKVDAVDRGGSPGHPYMEIVALARASASRPQFMQAVLRLTTHFYASPYAAIHVSYASEVLQDDYHTGPTDPKFWKASVQDFLTDSLSSRKARMKTLKSKTGDTVAAFLSAPIFDERGSTVGSLALVVVPVDESRPPGSCCNTAVNGGEDPLPDGRGSVLQQLLRQLVTLDAITGMASACAVFVGRGPSEGTSGSDGAPVAVSKASAAALDGAGAVASAAELAFSITNKLRSKLGCEQVALGLVQGKRVRVLSISGLDQVNRRSPGVKSLTAAMEECFDAREVIACRNGNDWEDDGPSPKYRLHKQWHMTAKGDAVASIPLRCGGSVVAILSLRSRADHPLTREQLERVRAHVEPYAAVLLTARKAGRNLLQHARESACDLVRAATAPGRYGRKAFAVLVFTASMWFFFGSLAYRVTVPCVVTAAHTRHIAAPMEGILSAAYFVEGDRVREGDILCEFDRRDIEQQLVKLKAELEVLERERDWAMAADKPVEVRLAVAKQHLVKAKLDIARRRADRTVIRAPFDGVIVEGDLRTLVGSLFSKGDPLFKVAPADHWKLELAVPQSSIADLAGGSEGVFISHARPDEARPLRLTHLLGTTQNRDGKNVYLAEADLAAGGEWLRPGMEGVARLELGPRPVWWVTLHGIIDYLRMRFWL